MMNFLLNRFAPEAAAREPAARARAGLFCGIVGIGANAALFLVKLLTGLAIGSVSVMADSFNNLSDAGSSVIALAGFRVSRKPPDAEHPFGHGRAEYIVSLVIAFLVLLLGYEFLKSSVQQIMSPSPVAFSGVSLAVLLAAAGVKVLLALFYRAFGKRLRSSSLLAVSVDSRNDVFVTLATVASVVLTRLTGVVVDGWVGAFVALVLLYSGWQIAKDAASPLLGEPADRETAAEIQRAVLTFDEILGVHDLIVHDYGHGHVIASIHAELRDTTSLPAAHEVIDRAERDISRRLGILLVIHIDPVDMDDPALNKLKTAVSAVLSEHAGAAAHDFRLSGTVKNRQFAFDLTPPAGYDTARVAALEASLAEACADAYPSAVCVIQTEYGFIESEEEA